MVADLTQQAVCLAPGVVIAGYSAMLRPELMNDAKVVVNCGSTLRFLNFLDEARPVVSSDVIVLNLDPNTSSTDAPYKEFHSRFNRILQNYLRSFIATTRTCSSSSILTMKTTTFVGISHNEWRSASTVIQHQQTFEAY